MGRGPTVATSDTCGRPLTYSMLQNWSVFSLIQVVSVSKDLHLLIASEPNVDLALGQILFSSGFWPELQMFPVFSCH